MRANQAHRAFLLVLVENCRKKSIKSHSSHIENALSVCYSLPRFCNKGALLLVETMTLLIADSSEEFCNSLIDALQGNYRIQTCRTGKEALEILRTSTPETQLVGFWKVGIV